MRSLNYHLYLTLIPETLVISMLNPKEFAAYYAIGERGKSSGQVLFIEIDPSFRHPFFKIDEGIARCIPESDGRPKSSVYIAIYRVLEHIPIAAMGNLYYVARDGRALSVSKTPASNNENGLHLYLELAPTRPAVVSSLGPLDFKNLMMGQHGSFQGIPSIAFAELNLGDLAVDPEDGATDDLPYENIPHLRNCLNEVKTKPIASKMFDLSGYRVLSFRVIKNGVYVGNADEGLCVYSIPPPDALRKHHYDWWRSINT